MIFLPENLHVFVCIMLKIARVQYKASDRSLLGREETQKQRGVVRTLRERERGRITSPWLPSPDPAFPVLNIL